jgi:hypothetical protein
MFEMGRHPNFVRVLRELVGLPFIFAIQSSKAELMDRVAVECSHISIYHRIMTVNPHGAVVVRE